MKNKVLLNCCYHYTTFFLVTLHNFITSVRFQISLHFQYVKELCAECYLRVLDFDTKYTMKHYGLRKFGQLELDKPEFSLVHHAV